MIERLALLRVEPQILRQIEEEAGIVALRLLSREAGEVHCNAGLVYDLHSLPGCPRSLAIGLCAVLAALWATPAVTSEPADDEGLLLVRVLRHVDLHQDYVRSAHPLLHSLLVSFRAFFDPPASLEMPSFRLLIQRVIISELANQVGHWRLFILVVVADLKDELRRYLMLYDRLVWQVEVEEELVVRRRLTENLRILKEGSVLIVTRILGEVSDLAIEALEGLEEDSEHLAAQRVLCDCGKFRLNVLPKHISLIIFFNTLDLLFILFFPPHSTWTVKGSIDFIILVQDAGALSPFHLVRV